MSSVPAVIELLGYRIHIGPWLLDQVGAITTAAAPAHTYAVITDDHVGAVAAPQVVASLRHFAPHGRIMVQSITPGEASKVRDTWRSLTDWLLDQRCGRDTTVVALGGGVVGDLAGFVAATFMRGVPYVQVPTSLLAMVDASVGGKVGVDTPHGKNLVGAFHQPAAVIIDPTVLQTLPRDEFRNGMAEVVKHGVIADAEYLEHSVDVGRRVLEDDGRTTAWDGPELQQLVERSVRIKAAVVAGDPGERPGGIRQCLNFGHTIGHAIEGTLDFGIPHGHAVAIGMAIEADLAVRLGLAANSLTSAIHDALRTLRLPVSLPPGISTPALVDAARLDKKGRAGRVVATLPSAIGTMHHDTSGYSVDVPVEVLADALDRGLPLN